MPKVEISRGADNFYRIALNVLEIPKEVVTMHKSVDGMLRQTGNQIDVQAMAVIAMLHDMHKPARQRKTK